MKIIRNKLHNSYWVEYQKAFSYYQFSLNWELRDKFIKKYAWAIPSDEVIIKLAKIIGTRKVIEIGAGTGYWAYLLEQMGIQVDCYDLVPPLTNDNVYCNPIAYPKGGVMLGGPEKLLEKKYKGDDWILFLCWPPYLDNNSENNHSTLTTDCINNWYSVNPNKRMIIYVGESDSGCTSWDDRIEDENSLILEIPQYWGIHDAVWITNYQQINQLKRNHCS